VDGVAESARADDEEETAPGHSVGLRPSRVLALQIQSVRDFVAVHAPDDFDMRGEVTGVQIYSSETRGWICRQSEWAGVTRPSCVTIREAPSSMALFI
jgi:hypothetical protein